jgi:spore germination protein YaaH
LLWGISYFSYHIIPKTGAYKSIHQWETTALIDSAKAHDCKVFLTVTNFGSKNNALFLTNLKAQQTLIDNLSRLLAIRSADGINIDFEGVSNKNRADLSNFIQKLSKSLKKVNASYQVSLCLYAIDQEDVFDIKAIDSYIDFYTLMGYDYYGGFSKLAGPVSPLSESQTFGKGISFSVQTYMDKGVDAQKLIVGLPYYGSEWLTENQKIPSKVKRFKSHAPYRIIRKINIDSLKIPVLFDKQTGTSYMKIERIPGQYEQLWFEDQQALALKYDWIKKHQLAGVGIWALGFDDGYPDLWELLDEKFSKE